MNSGLVVRFWIAQSRKASNHAVTSTTQRSGNPGEPHQPDRARRRPRQTPTRSGGAMGWRRREHRGGRRRPDRRRARDRGWRDRHRSALLDERGHHRARDRPRPTTSSPSTTRIVRSASATIGIRSCTTVVRRTVGPSRRPSPFAGPHDRARGEHVRSRHVLREVGHVVVGRMRHDLLGRAHLHELRRPS